MTSAARRRAVADAIDALDNEIATLQDSKRDTFDEYRDKLSAEGMRDGAIKLEIKALKKAIGRRRALLAKPAEVEEVDEKIDEITIDIMKNSVSGTRLATRMPVARSASRGAEAAFDAETGEVLGDAPAPAGEILYQDGSRFVAAAEMTPTEQEKADAAARGFPAPSAQPSASTTYRVEPRAPAPAPDWPEMPAGLDRSSQAESQEAAE